MDDDQSKQHHLLNTISYANGYSPCIPWIQSISYKPHPLRYAHYYPNRMLGEEYLINSYTTSGDIENHGSLEIYGSDSELTMLSKMEQRVGTNKRIELPASFSLDLSLGDVLVKRRSLASYTGDAVSFRHVATLLRAANGLTAQMVARSHAGNNIAMNLRTVASAGGLYPVSIYIVVLNVDGLKRGLYEYSPKEDVLFQIAEEAVIPSILSSFAATDENISFSLANCLFLLAGHPWKSMRKYGNKGLRFVLHELGAITQTLHLAATSLGLGSTDCAAYYENEMNALFEFDGVHQTILHTVISGMAG